MNWKSNMSFFSLSFGEAFRRHAQFLALVAAALLASIGSVGCTSTKKDAGPTDGSQEGGQPGITPNDDDAEPLKDDEEDPDEEDPDEEDPDEEDPDEEDPDEQDPDEEDPDEEDPDEEDPDEEDPDEEDPDEEDPVVDGTLLIDILSVERTPILEGTITLDDRSEPIIDGQVLLSGIPDGPLRGIVRATGFAPANLFGTIVADRQSRAQVFLMPIGATVVFPADQPVNLRFSTVGVGLQANSFVDGEGKLVSGEVTAHLTAFDPSLHMAAAPGPFRGVEVSSGELELMETFGMGEFSFEANGAPVNLGPGITATVEITLAPDVADVSQGEFIPAWSYDLELGHWVEEGMGQVRGGGERLVWSAEVPHFSWWNVDKAVTQKECIIVQVQSENNSGVPVYTEGVDYNGVDGHTTDSFGGTCVEFKQGGAARLRAGSGAYGFSYSLDVQGGGEAADCETSGGAGCTTVLIDVPPLNCVRGTINRNNIPQAGVMVTLSWGTSDTSLSFTAADGSFCSSAPVGAQVSIYASYIAPENGVFMVAEFDTVAGPESAACSDTGECTQVGTLELQIPTQYCLEGVAKNRVNATTVEDVPPGTAVYAFRTAGFTGVDCRQQPASWGSIVAKGSVSSGGSYCLTLPLDEDARNVIFAVDSCDVGSCATDLPKRLCSDDDAYDLTPGDEVLALGGTCETSGCLSNDILFE